ncbi:hypothetical protein GLP37_00705 [Photobacterium phosphoreum]|jgi:hypothetical protein|uniref:hypothetical protein n=1 Tax=Photobacterium TaxID=657 RepID=UPI001E6280D1|nr:MULTISPECIES: hypothetical protein [Photobacterium]MCD9500712.1 hypothetical protein [Photobacterium phosphoreum]MEC6906213.1 hypothetical protein [Photobacterium piscicola]
MCDKMVFNALNDNDYVWRTIDGIAKATNLKSSIVKDVIYKHGDLIVKSSAVNQNGEALYSLRSRQRQSGIFDRLSTMIKNRG